jgi:Zn finger protein HypA/HybF involved in hydrogenase expression
MWGFFKKRIMENKKCKNCFKCDTEKNRSYCKPCGNEINARMWLENKLENEPWRYVECSKCMEIWRLKKKRLKNGRMEGLKCEEYKRSNCPNCKSTALQFLNGRTLNTQRVKKEYKKRQKELLKNKRFERKIDYKNDYIEYSINISYNCES